MKKDRIVLIIIFFIIIIFYNVNVFADIYDVQTSFINFNKVEYINLNPAVIPDIKTLECYVEFYKPVAGLSEGYIDNFNGKIVLPYIPLKNGKVIGITGNYLRAGIGEGLPYFVNYNINIIYGYRLNNIFSIGIESKISRWVLKNYSLDDSVAGGNYNFDIGMKIDFTEDIILGTVIQNILNFDNSNIYIGNEESNYNDRYINIALNYFIFNENISLGLNYIIKNEEESGFIFGVEKKSYKNNFKFIGELIYLNNLILKGSIGVKLYKFEIDYTISYSLSLHYNGAHRIGLTFKY